MSSAEDAVAAIDAAASQLTSMLVEKGNIKRVNDYKQREIETRDLIQNEIRSLAPGFDFVNASKRSLAFASGRSINLPYLNTGVSLAQATISIKV